MRPGEVEVRIAADCKLARREEVVLEVVGARCGRTQRWFKADPQIGCSHKRDQGAQANLARMGPAEQSAHTPITRATRLSRRLLHGRYRYLEYRPDRADHHLAMVAQVRPGKGDERLALLRFEPSELFQRGHDGHSRPGPVATVQFDRQSQA